MAELRSIAVFFFGKLPLQQLGFAQAVEDTIADFVNSVPLSRLWLF